MRRPFFFVAAILLLPVKSGLAIDYMLPFHGRWFVAQGGDTPNVNHHMKVRSQRFGIDFLKAGGANGRQLSNGPGVSVQEFYSWSEPVLAPADGVVRFAVTDQPDNPIGIKDPVNAGGNYVVIQTASAEFVFLAHLQKGSVVVQKGDRVKKGQTIGKCGNSGNTDAPHIHMHVQDTPIPYKGSGLNVTFTSVDVELNGKKFENVSWPLIRGLFVRNAVSAPR